MCKCGFAYMCGAGVCVDYISFIISHNIILYKTIYYIVSYNRRHAYPLGSMILIE